MAAIAVAGLVGFIGLIVPHMVRNLVGGDTKRLLVGGLFVGPALLVVAGVGARLALNPVPVASLDHHRPRRRAALPLPDAQTGEHE